jgi:hypothetical protein
MEVRHRQCSSHGCSIHFFRFQQAFVMPNRLTRFRLWSWSSRRRTQDGAQASQPTKRNKARGIGQSWDHLLPKFSFADHVLYSWISRGTFLSRYGEMVVVFSQTGPSDLGIFGGVENAPSVRRIPWELQVLYSESSTFNVDSVILVLLVPNACHPICILSLYSSASPPRVPRPEDMCSHLPRHLLPLPTYGSDCSR